jgi:L-threonylcarbamoyladenylate synthase
MPAPLIGVIIGTRSDFTLIRKGLEAMRVMGVPYEFEVVSAQHQPERVAQWAREAADRGIEVIIAAAGWGASLASLVAANTLLPVIGIPLDGSPLRGQDALFAMAQSSPGVPLACVGINAAENAAVLATQILALKHSRFQKTLLHQQRLARTRLDASLKELQNEFPDLTVIEATAADDHRIGLTEMETDPGPMEDIEIIEANRRGEGERSPGAMRPIPAVNGSSAVRVEVDTPEPQEPSPPGAVVSEKITLAPEKRPGREKITAPKSDVVPPAPSPPPAKKKLERKAPPLADRLFRVNPENPDVDVIEHAMLTLLDGGIVAIPTDTVYGIAADATNPKAVERLYELKGRTRQKAIAILIHNVQMLSGLVMKFPERVQELSDEFWPGSLTLVLPKPIGALSTVSPAPTIGVRIPDHNTALALISLVARPLATTSANLADQPPATTAEEVIQFFGDKLDCILDAGPTPGQVASTVLSVVQSPYEILRQGAVSREELKRVLGDLLRD